MKTRVSVVVLCYNEERRLGECLEALKQQTVAPHEIIVVDNNSTDDSVNIAKSFGATVVHEKQQGIGFARSAGFGAATGDIIARIDADSVADSKWVETIIAVMNDEAIVAVGGVSYTYELRWIRPIANAIHSSFNRMHEHRLHGLTVLYGFNQAVRRSTWEKFAGELDPTSINEDIEFSVLVRQHGKIERCNSMIAGNRLAGFLRPKKMWRYWRADGKSAKRIRKEAEL